LINVIDSKPVNEGIKSAENQKKQVEKNDNLTGNDTSISLTVKNANLLEMKRNANNLTESNADSSQNTNKNGISFKLGFYFLYTFCLFIW
jgi:hypothetical protein